MGISIKKFNHYLFSKNSTIRQMLAPTEVVEEKGRGRTMKTEESDETRTIYLVMPSYAEPYKRQIMQILAKEKTNLCKSKTFDKVFFNITFKIEIMIIILN